MISNTYRLVNPSRPRSALFLQAILLLALAAGANALGAPVGLLPNVDSGLQKLASAASTLTSSATTATTAAAGPGRFDSKHRVLVHVYLNGISTMAAVSQAITGMNGRVLGTNASYGHGVFAAYLPTSQIAAASLTPGVRAMTMEYGPGLRVGKYTSQSAAVLRTDILNSAGLRGSGITVGVLSDSFDTAYEVSPPPATRAAQDVASGDLPVVNVLEDSDYGTDEGRAMCQLVYDEAPKCQLAFATAFESEVDFANNIVALRTQAGASVIVDDVEYYDEPFFSDGLLAQAVNTVATSKSIAGKPSVYLSAAGNDGNNGYRSADRNVSDAKVRKAGNHGNLKLNVSDPTAENYLDPSLTAGGWFNWNPSGGLEPSTTVEAPGPKTYGYILFLQWDDPFDQDDGITTSYNFLVFDKNGNYQPYLSSTTNAFSVQEPIQAIGYLSLGVQYQIAITRTAQTDPLAGPIPKHQLAIYTTLDGGSNLEGKYFSPAPLNVPLIFGHPAAKGALAVAAYAYSWRATLPYAPELENYTLPGPSTIYFDANMNRLKNPEVRQKPEVAGVDGDVTTFFGSPYYNFPYAFFGTSAAAPSIAGVVALMEQAGGGAGSIAPPKVKQALEAGTVPRNGTVETAQAFTSDSTGAVSVVALGQTYFGPNYLTVSFVGKSGDDIETLNIDGTAAGLVFDTTEFAVGSTNGITAQDVTVTPVSASTSSFTLKFKKGTFASGASFGFTIGQDAAGTYPGYTQGQYGVGVEAEDLAYGATAAFTFGSSKHTGVTLPFQEGHPTQAYLPSDGYGLVDAIKATLQILPSSSTLQLP